MTQIINIGIIGSGKMGSDIFNYLSDFNYRLVWHCLFDEEKQKHEKSFHKKISRQLKHGLINQEQYDFKIQFKITTDLLDFSDADMVIETITEDENEKKQLFKDLERIVYKNCIFVSNSSSILPSKLSNTIPVIGMHFFYPVALKKYVEIVSSETIRNDDLNKVKEFITAIGKEYILQDETRAFILNRFLLDIQLKAYHIVVSHEIDCLVLDDALRQLIPDFGIFEIIDQVGLDTMYTSILNYANMDENPNRFDDIVLFIKKQIDSNETFCNMNYEDESDENPTHYLYNDIKYFILTLVKNYIEKYHLNEDEFKRQLNDFCGIVL